MDNTPEFIITWLGMAKIGVVTALINWNLRGKQLIHSLRASGATTFVVGVEHVEAVKEIAAELPRGSKIYLHSGEPMDGVGELPSNFVLLPPLLAKASTARPAASARAGVGSLDKLFLIFTSGTTGLPKAATVTHLRFMWVALAFQYLHRVHSTDTIYCPLPLYHSAGGMVGVGVSWLAGIPFAFRRKFSATAFFPDCKKFDATIVQYIGELCRYLLSRPPSAADTDHKVRMAIGNGIRPDVWRQFIARFNIAYVGEFYGSTEGNCNLVNNQNRIGAVGFIPFFPYLKRMAPIRFVKFDMDKEEPVRGADGLCVECAPGEVGEIIGKITRDPLTRFEGYQDKKATEKKIMRDVLRKGDSWFRSGDLLRLDADGFVYFVDRIGDTFRWRGENVSTASVAEVLNVYRDFEDCNVYGVEVGTAEGRAGMAKVITRVPFAQLDLAHLAEYVMGELPAYARPLFLRFSREMEITGTFKHRKVDLVKDGFDPAACGDDDVVYLDAKAKTYKRLTAAGVAGVVAQLQ